ncbi:hypothetical protein SCA6_007507 [Theobroma cacao]
MDDYEVEFDRLSKFATSLVSHHESRARWFENSLNTHICRGLALLHLTSHNEVVHCILEELNCAKTRCLNKGLSVQCVEENIMLLNVGVLLVLALDVANKAISALPCMLLDYKLCVKTPIRGEIVLD